uniref:Uncharacterized protein n=1 Tax=Vespula pensylvanica TaxID=30213 RepID=A0A834KHW2_VESPE|nr:hypothetical protein H0235_014717 [Vespula pensylvanica]
MLSGRRKHRNALSARLTTRREEEEEHATSRSEPFFSKIPKGFGKTGREVIKMRYVSGDLLKRPAFENSFDSLAEQRRERLNGNEAMAGEQTDG